MTTFSLKAVNCTTVQKVENFYWFVRSLHNLLVNDAATMNQGTSDKF